ncbi:MAG: Glu/Leu/Phe/Val dehydrogenase family protein [Deltaproteobacteria bacterium]|nr:Glu/Leu/Phe/Val dehydrogenase family protein [Deltaproteobacteria bacterium]
MERSLFTPIIEEGLTTLKINYDYKSDKSYLLALKEWDDDIKWEDYNEKFYMETILTSNLICLDDTKTRKLFEKYGLLDYLNSIIELLRKGKHFGIDCFYFKKKDIRFISNMHNNTLGINNRRHAVRSGGIRRHDLDEDEYEIIIDGLNLARGMSFKNAAAEIPYGGSKIVVQSAPVDLDDMEELGFLAYAIDRSHSFTGPDMGYPPELADAIKERFTLNIAGGIKGIGPTGTPTAYGVYLAVKEASKFLFGTDSLKDKKIAVQGLGAVGFTLAEHYLKEGAYLFVADIDDNVVKKLIDKYPNNQIKPVKSDEIFFVDADIFSPCAIGGIITEDRIPKMKFKIIMGGANNQLRASSQEEEYRLAKILDKHGILFQVAWWHNVGGVLAGWEEYENQENASLSHIIPKIERICTIKTRENLKRAKDKNITPTESAYKSVEELIYR